MAQMSMRLCLVDERDGVPRKREKDDPHTCTHNGHLRVMS